MPRFILGLLCWTAIATVVQAGDPKQQPEQLPAPRIAPQAPYWIPYAVESNVPRPGSVEMWQHYGVNRLGRFVPRVIMLPDGGAYYSRDLQPFPWVPRSAATMPYAN